MKRPNYLSETVSYRLHIPGRRVFDAHVEGGYTPTKESMNEEYVFSTFSSMRNFPNQSEEMGGRATE